MRTDPALFDGWREYEALTGPQQQAVRRAAHNGRAVEYPALRLATWAYAHRLKLWSIAGAVLYAVFAAWQWFTQARPRRLIVILGPAGVFSILYLLTLVTFVRAERRNKPEP